jgi:hypothetical protein
MEFMNEIGFLRNKLKLLENEKEKMAAKLNQYQQENLELKTKLMTITQMNSSDSDGSNSNYHQLENNYNNHKSGEVENLKKIIQDLIKSNDEKVNQFRCNASVLNENKQAKFLSNLKGEES